VSPELKARIVAEAKHNGKTLADYIRWVVEENTKGDDYGAKN
jgi:predicted DNA-binding protein